MVYIEWHMGRERSMYMSYKINMIGKVFKINKEGKVGKFKYKLEGSKMRGS